MAPRKGGQAGTYLASPYQVTVSYGNAKAGIVRGSGADWMGPLNPIAPIAPPEVAGRQWDYPAGFNLQTQPRPYAQVGFAELRALADGYDVLRTVIETRKDQISRMQWTVKARDKSAVKNADARIKAALEFLAKPDGYNAWDEWLRIVLEDLFVLDAPALYMHRNRGGALIGLLPLDGATIKPVIDDWGRRPSPSVDDSGAIFYPVAYQQILKGYPAVDYTTRDLLYRPRNTRVNRAFGFGPVEQIMTTINIALRRQLFLLDYYTDGNIPDSLIGTPENWTPDQIKAFQMDWDSYFEGNLAKRRRAKFIPGGMAKTFVQTKEPELKNDFDEWLIKIVCFSFSISPQPFIKQMNRASADTQKQIAEEEGLAPVLKWIKTMLDGVLADEFASPDLEFSWSEDEEVDEAKQAEILQGNCGKGLMALNEARAKMGLDPSSNPAADTLMVLTATGYVPIEANTIAGRQATLEAFGPPPGEMGPDGKPAPNGGPTPAKAGKAALSRLAFTKAAGRRPAPVPFDRPKARIITRRFATRIAAALRAERASVLRQLANAPLGKAGDDEAPPDDPEQRRKWAERKAESIAEDVTFADLEALASDDALEELAADTVAEAIAGLGVELPGDLVDQVNDRAVAIARERAAEMVGKTVLEDGTIIDNPNAEWSITESTRDMIRDAIAQGLEDNIGRDEIIANIADIPGFDEDRAELIADTEIARMNSLAALETYKAGAAIGVETKKEWLVTTDACDICQDNADQGPIDLDEAFSSGDDATPAHPRCRCAIGPVVYDEESEGADTGELEAQAA